MAEILHRQAMYCMIAPLMLPPAAPEFQCWDDIEGGAGFLPFTTATVS